MPPFTSVENAVIPTAVVLGAPSCTVPPVGAAASTGCVGATSFTVMLKLWLLNAPAASVARTVTL